MKYVGSLLILLAIQNFISGCTGNGNSQAGLGSTSPTTDGPVSDANQITPEEAQSLIKKVQEETINSHQYALTEQDINQLTAEGLIESDELKAWVE